MTRTLTVQIKERCMTGKDQSEQTVAPENEALKRELEREIARRRKLEEALRESDLQKEQFLAMLAHDLRNSLTPISNAAQIMKVQGLNGPHFEWSVKVIEDQIKSVTRMVDELLDISRILRGQVVLRKEPVELQKVVDLAVETSQPLIEQHHHHLTVTLPTHPILLEVAPMRLAQVFSNLLNNAAKYTDPGGEISLSAEEAGCEIVVCVRDNGMGIAPDLLPHVFDIFAQADPTVARSRSGLDLGLALVRSLVEMHDGQVSASSSGPGQGSEFTVRIPLAAQAESPMML
jgi:signal transduction histidine kinase